ncbi:fimbrial protein [Serratia fonticola]|uniref:fimbrial protein n=1 Tax=Serratia fonticola TaxID=47917 RepID=UPI0021BD1709|nr:fimbrial protein [Serratia fonticola]
MLNHKARQGLVALLSAAPLLASAVTTITVKVTVMPTPPCVINDDKVIEVDFGEVVAPQVDGVQYQRTVNYTLECEADAPNAMKLQVQGSPTTFDPSALRTNFANFGVALRVNGQPLVLNDWVDFTYPQTPLLQAVPVKKAGVTLPGGNFSAGATLMLSYQ